MAPKCKAKGKAKGRAKGKAKRPARPAIPTGGKRSSRQVLLPPAAAWIEAQMQETDTICHPDWCAFFCAALKPYFLQLADRATGQKIWINVWSDCAGLASEMFAGSVIQKHLETSYGIHVEFALYLACDKDAKARELLQANHSPRHLAGDILDRNWEDGTLNTVAGKVLNFPTGAIELYVSGFPCGPWSMRGARRGFADDNSQAALASLKTIKMLQPKMFILENVLQMATSRSVSDVVDDAQVIQNYFKAECPGYAVVVLRGVTPPWSGYPVGRKRLMIVGRQIQQGCVGKLAETLQAVMSSPFPTGLDYYHFLCRGDSDVDWSLLHTLPDPATRMSLGACTCSLDPYAVCESHPCKCRICNQSAGKRSACIWRSLHAEFLQKKEWVDLQADIHKLTYCQTVELSGKGERLPRSQRERNMLNILSHLPRLQPVSSTLGVLDISQSIERAHLMVDGCIPTLATSSEMLCMRDARRITTMQLASLMGHCPRELKLATLTQPQFQTRLGLSIHVSSIGIVMLALLASS
jgi:hypothetical protein